MITSNETDKILPALFELKKQLKPMAKDSKNPFFKSNYLKLEDLLDNLEPLLIDQGLIVSQANAHRYDDEYVISRLTHSSSGQYVEAEYRIGFTDDSQKQGAKATYGRRYSLKGLLGLSERDDDGNTASGNTVSKSASKPSASKPSASKPVAAAPAKPSGFGASAPVVNVSEPVKAPARSGSFGS